MQDFTPWYSLFTKPKIEKAQKPQKMNSTWLSSECRFYGSIEYSILFYRDCSKIDLQSHPLVKEDWIGAVFAPQNFPSSFYLSWFMLHHIYSYILMMGLRYLGSQVLLRDIRDVCFVNRYKRGSHIFNL